MTSSSKSRLMGVSAAALLAISASTAPLAAGASIVGGDDGVASGHGAQGFDVEMIVADNPSDKDNGTGNDPPGKKGGGGGGGGSSDGSGNGSPGKSGSGNS